MNKGNGIELVQKPVITHDLVKVGASVTERLKALNIDGQVATIETVQALKKLRAELNKEHAEYDLQVKAVKQSVMLPYTELEMIYKEEVSVKYDNADKLLKDKISFVEDEVKSNKKKAVEGYFNELCLAEKIDFVTFENVGIEINLSTTEKAYKEKCTEFISKIVDDLALIETQEFKAEILVQYRKTLNASKAIKEIQERKELERQETERQKLQEVARRKSIVLNYELILIDFVNIYEYKDSSEIFVTIAEIENLSKEEFSNKIIQIELAIKAHIEANTVQPTTLDTAPVYEVKYVATTPLGAPKIINNSVPVSTAPIIDTSVSKASDLVTASFECTGTIDQLKSVGAFMKQNNITYKNI